MITQQIYTYVLIRSHQTNEAIHAIDDQPTIEFTTHNQNQFQTGDIISFESDYYKVGAIVPVIGYNALNNAIISHIQIFIIKHQGSGIPISHT